MRKKDLSKLIALAVVLGGVTCSSSVWATGSTIQITATGSTAAPSLLDPSVITLGDNCGAAIGVKAGTMGEQVYMIQTGTGASPSALSDYVSVFGIRANNSNVTASSIIGGIDVRSSADTTTVCGIAVENDGQIDIAGLGNVNAYSANQVMGLDIESGDDDKTVFSTNSSITAKSTSSAAYGIMLFGTGNRTISELGSITAVTNTSSNSLAYGICFENSNTDSGSKYLVSFAAAGGSISAYSATGENYGIKFNDGSTGKSEVLNVKSITAGVDPDDSAKCGKEKSYGIYAEAGVNKVTFTGVDSSITAKSEGTAYGIYANGKTASDGLNVTFSGVNSSITATSSQGHAYGIKLEGAGTNYIENLGSIKALGDEYVYGICVGETSNNAINTITFFGTDRSIIAKGDNDAEGLFFYSGTNNIGTGSGKELTTIRVGFTDEKDTEIQQGGAYGIRAIGGTNTVAFGTDSSIAAKTSSSVAFGIAYGDIGLPGTGKTKITGLGSIVAETYDNTNGSWVFGIYAKNGNKVDAGTTFSVAMNNGNISAYSALGTALTDGISGNYGICFYRVGDETGKSEILNVKTITAGVQSGSNPEKITSGNSCGICAQAGENTVTFTGTDSFIIAQSSGTIDKDEQPIFARGIYVESGSNTITNLENIVAKGAGGSYGIQILGGSNNIDIGDGQKLKSIRAGFTSDSDIQAGVAYGICAEYGTNNIAFGSESSVVAKSSGSDAYGISLTGGNGANHTISGLGSVTAEAKGESANAYGIYSINFHEAPVSSEEAATFSVAFDTADNTTGGSISAYSASGENYGIKFNDGSTGKSEVLNVKSITAGVDPEDAEKISSDAAYGVYAKAGVNTVTFTGADSSITAKSSVNADGIELLGGTNYIGTDASGSTGNELESIKTTVTVNGGTGEDGSAVGIDVGESNSGTTVVKFAGAGSFVTAESDAVATVGIFLKGTGTVTIYDLGSITANTKGDQSYGICVLDGTNEISFKGNGGQAITTTAGVGGATYIIYVTGGSTTVNFEDSILSGKIYQQNTATLELNFNNDGAWTPTTDDVTGTVNVNVNSGGKIVFDLPAFTVAGDTVLQMNGTVAINDDSKIQVINGRATQLQEGDEVCLIDSSQTITLDNNVVKQDSSDGITWSEAEIYLKDTDDSQLIYKMGKRGLDPDGSKAPVEGMAAAVAAINSNTDLALGAGISNLITSTAAVNSGMETFGAANYSKARLNTGSHVDAKGYGIMVGVGKKVFSKAGNKTTGGLYFEYGNSDFDTYNGSVTGNGKGIQKGVGYMMRWDNKSGNYYEGMLHGGKVTTNWSNSNGGYDVSPTYFGGAATYGHKFMLGEDKQLSVYGSYIYNRIGGSDAKIDKYDYNFDATRSHRTKVGVRYAVSDLMDTKKFRPYIGLAWEHEFDGETGATVKGFDRVDSPSMKGDSGILELGCKQEVGKWTLGIGAEIFTGKRRGWNGTLNAIYNF